MSSLGGNMTENNNDFTNSKNEKGFNEVCEMWKQFAEVVTLELVKWWLKDD